MARFDIAQLYRKRAPICADHDPRPRQVRLLYAAMHLARGGTVDKWWFQKEFPEITYNMARVDIAVLRGLLPLERVKTKFREDFRRSTITYRLQDASVHSSGGEEDEVLAFGSSVRDEGAVAHVEGTGYPARSDAGPKGRILYGLHAGVPEGDEGAGAVREP